MWRWHGGAMLWWQGAAMDLITFAVLRGRLYTLFTDLLLPNLYFSYTHIETLTALTVLN